LDEDLTLVNRQYRVSAVVHLDLVDEHASGRTIYFVDPKPLRAPRESVTDFIAIHNEPVQR
jgi:hypothetical protein